MLRSKDPTSSPFVTKVITYPLYFDLIKVIHDFGLYLKLNSDRGDAPSLYSMYQVIVERQNRNNNSFGNYVKALNSDNFSTHYRDLLSVKNLVPRNNIQPSILFAFLTLYNYWLQHKVLCCKDEPLLEGGAYVKTTLPSGAPTYGIVHFNNESNNSKSGPTPDPAHSIYQFDLKNNENPNRLYNFAVLFFELSARKPSNYFNEAKQMGETWKNKCAGPIIPLSTKNNVYDNQTPSTKRRKQNKNNGKITTGDVYESKHSITNSTTATAGEHKTVQQPKSSNAAVAPHTVSLQGTRSAMLTYAPILDSSDPERRKTEYLTMFNQITGEKHTDFDQLLKSNSNQPTTTSKTVLPANWLASYNKILRKHNKYITIKSLDNVSVRYCLTNAVIQDLFKVKHTINDIPRIHKDNFIVLAINTGHGNNNQVYRYIGEESNESKVSWIRDTVKFINEAVQDKWELNDIETSTKIARGFIVLCNETMRKKWNDLTTIGTASKDGTINGNDEDDSNNDEVMEEKQGVVVETKNGTAPGNGSEDGTTDGNDKDDSNTDEEKQDLVVDTTNDDTAPGNGSKNSTTDGNDKDNGNNDERNKKRKRTDNATPDSTKKGQQSSHAKTRSVSKKEKDASQSPAHRVHQRRSQNSEASSPNSTVPTSRNGTPQK
jgi:hypothetical protein